MEVYIDTSNFTSSQTLVIQDDNGKRWDVAEALNSSGSSDGASRRKRNNEVILERWKIELKDNLGERTYDFGSTLPTVYKKCIVFFRSLYSTAKIVPASKFVKSLHKNGSRLKINCRIVAGGGTQPGRFDPLTHPLYDSDGPVTSEYVLGTTDTPAGQFSAEVSYRNDCNFRVDDAESILSSRFMGADEHFFQPSLPTTKGDPRRRNTKAAEVGSLPAHRQRGEDSGPVQAYGSLSTFHGNNVPPRGSSPISALRNAKTMGSDTNSPPPDSLPHARPLNLSRASLKSLEGVQLARKSSLSFQPFKAGSLSSSPGRITPVQQTGEMSPQSAPRPSGISALALAQARNRSSLTAGMPATLRGGPVVPENAVPSSASSSPKPAPISRYSSSFSHRRNRPSFGGTSRVIDDDQGSSGKQSLSSSVQPGSGILAEGGTGGSSGSLQTDDDNIGEFLKLLESKKTLQSFEPSNAAAKKTSAQLSKFQSMRESNNALTESMSSSTLLHRSSSSSSRQLSSVPHMVAATSMSASSSPGKPISPHTPHTPAIPSRLSANSIAEYTVPRRLREQNRNSESQVEHAEDDGTNELGTYAINIPTSPRPYYPHNRRSSSVAQNRSLAAEDDLADLPFGPHRSISLGADDREPPSLSALLGLGDASDNVASPTSPSPCRLLQPAPHIAESSTAMSRQGSSSLEAQESDVPRSSHPGSRNATNSPYRPRIGRSGRGATPPQTGSSSSLIERGSGSGTSERAGRYSFTGRPAAYEADDEPLLFDMSEIGRDISRRSIEEPRGSANNNERGGYDTGRGGDSGSSSRRGLRRAW